MCGIFGYIGATVTDAASLARAALCELEYRGYDSWGIATSTQTGIVVNKAVGRVSDTERTDLFGIQGAMAIGHSRWATHGGVTQKNSHPHLNQDGTIAVIHNGIVENHVELRAFLVQARSISEKDLFVSETDTEVIPHLIDHFSRLGYSFTEAFLEMGKMIQGRFAIVAMKHGEPYLLAMRDGSPLVLGKGSSAHYLASDVPAFLDATRTVCYPNDHECATIFHDRVTLTDIQTGRAVDPVWSTIHWNKASASKEGYPHYMLKEIMEQPHTIDTAIRQESERLHAIADAMHAAEKLFLVGCGTAAQMAHLGELYLAGIGGKLARSIVGSEFLMYERFLDRRTLLFAISQSGETADVLEALRHGTQAGTKVMALLNVVGSSMDRISEHTLFLNTGPEIAVASTKAATAQIAILLLLAHALGEILPKGRTLMQHAVQELRAWIAPELSEKILPIAYTLEHATDLYIIGRGFHAPIAREAAIKIQEVSYLHAEGFAGGELKHGPIALIQPGTPVIAFVPNDGTKQDMLSNTAELRARGARVIGIGPESSPLFETWIETPDLDLAAPIASIIPVQLLAYHLAVLRGHDPDRPRNLAKSVTVK